MHLDFYIQVAEKFRGSIPQNLEAAPGKRESADVSRLKKLWRLRDRLLSPKDVTLEERRTPLESLKKQR